MSQADAKTQVLNLDYSRFAKQGDVMLAAGVVVILFVMLVPLPTPFLDFMLTVSISLGLVILVTSMFMSSPMEFSIFPSLLLVTTLLRLALNVASTRLILLHGDEGTSAAGKVIQSFGEFVVGGNYAIGIVIFFILFTLNKVVIVAGTTRNAEVAARFTLDAMPGKQMAIDADLNAGLIDEQQARARRALVRVARDTLVNQRLHQKQIEGFVQVGTRPPIDLAQARTDVANAELQLIRAENDYLTARAQLNQAMGVHRPVDFEVAEETLPPVPGEDGSGEALVQRALGSRPELRALAGQQKSQQQLVRAARGAYFPALGVGLGVSETGDALDDLQLNWSAGVTLTWSLFSGLQTRSEVRQARATLTALEAQTEAEALQIRLEVITAALGVRGAKAAIVAAEEARRNARERLRLAEGRYAPGVGSGIELSDAQTAATQAEAQVIQAEFDLASARARLLAALGER
jgi:hypothetical protein